MKSVVSKIKPVSGFSQIFHVLLLLLLPAAMFVLVRINLVPIAAGLVVLSKWRMFAVRPRYWLANLRANAVDLMVGLSLLVFMSQTTATSWQLLWAVVYAIWLILIKPGSSTWKVALQAGVGQLFALMALFMGWGGATALLLVVACWVICYMSARHFFTAFDEEERASLLAHTWGYFAAALAWVLAHWLLYYGVVAQITLILSVFGFGLAVLYYLDQSDRLSPLLRRQFIFIMVAVVVVVLVFSNWGDRTV